MIAVGADLGNDSLKIVFGANHFFKIKNSVSQRMVGEIRKNLNLDSKLGDEGLLKDLDVYIKSDEIEGRFFVGDLASKHGENEVEVGTHKTNNPFLIIPLITMLAVEVPGHLTKGDYNVVCGLPITEFTEDREQFKQKIKGNYEVTFMSGSLKDRKVVVSIHEVIVVPEGVAVIMNQMLNETGTGFRNMDLRNGQVGVIDIGAFTTDIPVIVNGKPDSDASDGIADGIANYLDKIVRYVNDTYQVNMTRSRLVDHLEKGQLTLHIKGKEVDLSSFVTEQFQIFAQKIVSKVDNIWANHFEIKQFYVVGGGAKALEDMLRKEMTKRDIHLTFIEDEDPQIQNAMGYWKYGKQKFKTTAGV